MAKIPTGTIRLHLISGAVIVAQYQDDEYDYMYDAWARRRDEVLVFLNCCVHAKDILLIEYID